MNKYLFTCFLCFFSTVTWSAQFEVTFEIPKIDTAEYHRPYVAVWIETDARQPHARILVWVEQEKWFRDLRSWWRRGGSTLAFPVDGVSGATRKPGVYQERKAVDLPLGNYTLNIEAVREVGGREHIKVPLVWQGQAWSHAELGDSELGKVSFSIEP